MRSSIIIAAAGVAFAAAGLYLWPQGQQQSADSGIAVSGGSNVEVARRLDGGETGGSVPQPTAGVDSSQAPATSPSPFAVAESQTPVTTRDQAAESTVATGQIEEQTTAAVEQPIKRVVVPAGGYPVEDAMKYYVPRDQRGPGNLGGPPPPVWMVPENADGIRSVDSMLAPPPAPGISE